MISTCEAVLIGEELEELVEFVEVLIGVEVDFSLSVSSERPPAHTHTHMSNWIPAKRKEKRKQSIDTPSLKSPKYPNKERA